ncbi:hypothetical protein POM88_007553 [Heracleum sosnowskyi]|uniref:GED domain-containing protein n=1 Tax=Heracleum sosnowskyi TaxID=360622 RepID=A0AAD8J8B3_9APIA|nr:hypothetical protein POM88_007553 [Heracleum sosnowskyi]
MLKEHSSSKKSYSYAESLVGVNGIQLTGNEAKNKKVNHTKRQLHNVFIRKMYRDSLLEEMLREPEEVSIKRKRTSETLHVLQQAFQTLDELPLEAIPSRGVTACLLIEQAYLKVPVFSSTCNMTDGGKQRQRQSCQPIRWASSNLVNQSGRQAATTAISATTITAIWEASSPTTAYLNLGADVIYDPLCIPHLIRVLSIILRQRKADSHALDESSEHLHDEKFAVAEQADLSVTDLSEEIQ